jgi:hypothetical protein
VIRDHPELIGEHIQRILRFFTEKLAAPVSTARYYWETVTNVISGVFDAAFSYVSNVDLGTFIGPILARMPVRGDLSEASYIYEIILSLASTQMSLLLPHVEHLFRVLVETLAFSNEWFEDVDFREGTVENMVALLHGLNGRLPNWEAAAEEILHADQVKLTRLHSRIARSP